MSLKKCLFISLLCAAQSNSCMDAEQPIAGNPPSDGNKWIEVKYSGNLYQYESDHGQFKDFPKFGNPGKLAAVSLSPDVFGSGLKQPEWFAMPHQNFSSIHYARIRGTSIEIFTTKSLCTIDCHNGIKHISPAFIRGLTLPEMKEFLKGNILYILCRSFRKATAENWNNTMEHFDELATANAAEVEEVKKKYKTLRNLNPEEQQRYVRDRLSMLTLLGIRAKKVSPLSVIPKDVLRDCIIKPVIPLNLDQPKNEQPQ